MRAVVCPGSQFNISSKSLIHVIDVNDVTSILPSEITSSATPENIVPTAQTSAVSSADGCLSYIEIPSSIMHDHDSDQTIASTMVYL